MKNQKFEKLILEAMVMAAKEVPPPEIQTLEMIRDYIGIVRRESEGYSDIHIGSGDTKIKNAMGRVANLGADNGFMIVPVRRSTKNNKEVGHIIEGWIIAGEEDQEVIDREFRYLRKRTANHVGGTNRYIDKVEDNGLAIEDGSRLKLTE